jgi:hypothetical protein
MVGSLIDAENQRKTGIISEQDTRTREQAVREEMRKEFRTTRAEMTASVRQIILAINQFPPGQRRTRAIQSALLDYDRAASRLGPESSTGVASLLPLAVERSLTVGAQLRDESQPQAQPQSRQPTREEATTAVTTTAAATPAITTGAETAPIIVPPIFIPPPPPTVVMPPPIVTSPH